jgi:nitrite reductase/ring-hydroxylating ferredoxin subunit
VKSIKTGRRRRALSVSAGQSFPRKFPFPPGARPNKVIQNKPKEPPRMPECFVAKASDLKDGDRRIVVSGQHEVGVFFKDGAYYAYSNYCVHAGGPACEGILVNNVVDILNPDKTYEGQTFGDNVHFACPWHGYEYDLKTGECIGDRKLKLRKYNVVKRGDEIFVVI